jgi:signal transduction histidine kinase
MADEQALELNYGIPQSKRLLLELEKIFNQLEVNIERNELIREMDKAILRSTFSPQEVFNIIVQKGLSKTGSQHGQVVQYRRNRLVVAASTESKRVGQELPLQNSLCGKAVLEREMQHYQDVSQISPENYVRYNEETKSELAVLIKPEHSTRILGVLDLEREQLGFFDQTEVAFAELLAGQAAIAIGHTQTWTGIKMLYEISTSLLSGELTLEKGYQTILEAILEGFDFEHGQILRLVGDEFVIIASSYKDDIGLRPGRDTSICGRYLIAEGGRTIKVIDDIESSPYTEFYLRLLQADSGRPMRSEMIVPLIENNHLIGALNIESPQVGIFSDLESNLLGLVSGLMASAISATFTRTSRVNKSRIQAANLALTQLGNVAQSFLHRFNNSIGNARGRLLELNDHLRDSEIPAIRDGQIPVTDFIADVTKTLTEARKIIDEFSDRFNPNDPRFQIQQMSMEVVAKTAFEKAKERYAPLPIEFRFENRMPKADNLLPLAEDELKKDVGSQSLCHLSDQVYEVLDNLLDNAVEAIMERGTGYIDGYVNMVLELPDPFHVRLQIKDNGPGIDEAIKQRIFEFGFTTRKKKRGSRGIGLPFCELYIQQKGGQISFTSPPGEGTTFEVILPTILTDPALL